MGPDFTLSEHLERGTIKCACYGLGGEHFEHCPIAMANRIIELERTINDPHNLRQAFHALADKRSFTLQIEYNGLTSESNEDTWATTRVGKNPNY